MRFRDPSPALRHERSPTGYYRGSSHLEVVALCGEIRLHRNPLPWVGEVPLQSLRHALNTSLDLVWADNTLDIDMHEVSRGQSVQDTLTPPREELPIRSGVQAERRLDLRARDQHCAAGAACGPSGDVRRAKAWS